MPLGVLQMAAGDHVVLLSSVVELLGVRCEFLGIWLVQFEFSDHDFAVARSLPRMAAVDHDGRAVLRGDIGRRSGALRQPGILSHLIPAARAGDARSVASAAMAIIRNMSAVDSIESEV